MIRSSLLVVSLIALLAPAGLFAQTTGGKAPSADLIQPLAKELSSTPKQAEGAAGALFALAKTRLAPDDFTKIAGAVPGMDQLLAAAPKATSPAVSMASALGGQAAGLASAVSAFSALGLKPELVAKAIPILTQYVGKMGGPALASLLGGVLK
ncbi:MAG TPA: DUF2780 domain-containing protein [Vicinamibacterales bacterium]|nr:DUF2780 domain-containing protein [Vicinamibacterales bacterium]